MNHMLHEVSLGIHSQMKRCGLVAPLNFAFRIKQHHAIGRGLNGLQKILQTLLFSLGLATLIIQNTAHAIYQVAPYSVHLWRLLNIVMAQPHRNFLTLPQIDENCEKANQRCAQQVPINRI